MASRLTFSDALQGFRRPFESGSYIRSQDFPGAWPKVAISDRANQCPKYLWSHLRAASHTHRVSQDGQECAHNFKWLKNCSYLEHDSARISQVPSKRNGSLRVIHRKDRYVHGPGWNINLFRATQANAPPCTLANGRGHKASGFIEPFSDRTVSGLSAIGFKTS